MDVISAFDISYDNCDNIYFSVSRDDFSKYALSLSSSYIPVNDKYKVKDIFRDTPEQSNYRVWITNGVIAFLATKNGRTKNIFFSNIPDDTITSFAHRIIEDGYKFNNIFQQ